MAFVFGNSFVHKRRGETATSSRTKIQMTLVNVDTTITVKVGDTEKQIPANTEVDLRRNLKESGIDIYTFKGKLTNCGGNGSCGTCRVRLMAGFENVNPRTPREDAVLRKQGAAGDIRLACRTMISGPVKVETKPQ